MRALQLMGIRFVSTMKRRPFEGAEKLAVAEQRGPFRLLRVPGALNRYNIVASHVEMSEDQALAEMQRGSFDPHSLVLLIDDDRRNDSQARPGPSQAGARVAVLREEPEEIELVAEAPEAAWLLALRSYFPGWRATVNGGPVEIRRANVAYMAIPLTQGTNRIQLRYEPASFRIGAVISVVSLLTLASVLALSVVRARLRRPAS
jgi:hypothetical protein